MDVESRRSGFSDGGRELEIAARRTRDGCLSNDLDDGDQSTELKSFLWCLEVEARSTVR